MTVRKNGADTGTLKTRMGFLIRDSAHHGTGSAEEGVAPRVAPSFRGRVFDAPRNDEARRVGQPNGSAQGAARGQAPAQPASLSSLNGGLRVTSLPGATA